MYLNTNTQKREKEEGGDRDRGQLSVLHRIRRWFYRRDDPTGTRHTVVLTDFLYPLYRSVEVGGILGGVDTDEFRVRRRHG